MELGDVQRRFGAKFGGAGFSPRFNAAPSQELPVGIDDGPTKVPAKVVRDGIERTSWLSKRETDEVISKLPQRWGKFPGVVRREHWRPGQYVGVATRRLLWISDGYDGGRDLYGTVSGYVPLSQRMDVTLTYDEESCELGLAIASDFRWAVPADLHGEAESFTRELHRLRLNLLSEARQ
jgi:hypothetical protein